MARVSNLDRMFKLSEFWSRHIDDELQAIGGQVSDDLRFDGVAADEDAVRNKLLYYARSKERDIGRHGLAICHSAVYRFAAATPSVVSDILRQCREQASYATSKKKECHPTVNRNLVGIGFGFIPDDAPYSWLQR